MVDTDVAETARTPPLKHDDGGTNAGPRIVMIVPPLPGPDVGRTLSTTESTYKKSRPAAVESDWLLCTTSTLTKPLVGEGGVRHFRRSVPTIVVGTTWVRMRHRVSVENPEPLSSMTERPVRGPRLGCNLQQGLRRGQRGRMATSTHARATHLITTTSD